MIEAIVAAALHALAVSCILGAVLFLVIEVLVRSLSLSAAVRHGLWFTALCATAIMPLGALAASTARAVSVPFTPPANQKSSQTTSPTDANAARTVIGTPAAAPLLARSAGVKALEAALHPNRTAAFALVGVWLVGAAGGTIGLMLGLNRVRGLKRRSSALEGDLAGELPWLTQNGSNEREIYLRLSFETETPVAVGFRRPVILLPTQLATAGGLRAIEGLVMHEHAHLRRRDDWTNLVQRLIERIFWFNPLVWLLGRRIALEREIASDDAVVAAMGRPDEYAKSLWQLAREMRMPEHSVVAPGALFTRKQISVRIEALLERRPVRAHSGPIAALTVGFTAVACTVAVAANAPGLALPEPRSTPVAHVRPTTRSNAAVAVSSTIREPQTPPEIHPRRPVATVTAAARTLTALPHIVTAAVQLGLGRAATSLVAQADRLVNPSRSPRVAGTSRAARTPAAAALSCSACDLSGRDLRGLDLRGIVLNGANLSGADLRNARLDNANLTGVDLTGAQLDGASLRNATLTGTDIGRTSLRGVNTHGLRIFGVSFAHMDLRDLDVRAMLDACTGCDFESANLRNADMHGIQLTGANFASADLHGANLRGANLTGANFDNSNLDSADLRDASFVGSSFADSSLRGALVMGAKFDGSNLSSGQR